MTLEEVRALKTKLLTELRETGTIAERVARRYVESFKYEPKEKKQSKVDRLMRHIREVTGVSRGVAGDIADALVRGRDVPRLAIQKGWPIEGDAIIGPEGSLDMADARSMI